MVDLSSSVASPVVWERDCTDDFLGRRWEPIVDRRALVDFLSWMKSLASITTVGEKSLIVELRPRSKTDSPYFQNDSKRFLKFVGVLYLLTRGEGFFEDVGKVGEGGVILVGESVLELTEKIGERDCCLVFCLF